MPDDPEPLTFADRRLLNRCAEQARHWRDMQDLRDQEQELRQGTTPCTTTRR